MAAWRRPLLAWYDRNRRALPWRKDRDPYRVWLSEIMLQQTRVAAVIEPYRRFLRKFPTVHKLAAARESSVLAAWSGLGYYRRARLLHAAAKEIVREHGGRFPRSAAELRELPGIGRYTAAAVASIAFDQAAAVVDGNVRRVLERMWGRELGGEDAWPAAQEFLHPQRPGDFNQAVMELGATVCLPRQPLCLVCPVAGGCRTHGNLPKARNPQRQTKREIQFVLDRQNDAVFLVQRPPGAALMPGMWELPEASANGDAAWLTLRHSITVTDYIVKVRRGQAGAADGGQWVAESRLDSVPLTGLARKILKAAEIL